MTQEQQNLFALKPGTLLHGAAYQYKIERALGSGTFGITYLATVKMAGALGSIDTDVRVAIKEFFMCDINGRENSAVTGGSQRGLYADYRRKFIREARNLSKLQHPGIIKVIEAFEENNTVYYAMEYIDGGSLDNLIFRSGGLPQEQVVDYTRQIGAALSFMHATGMLHLDLKPSNIMLRQGRPVLIDFGLSKQYDDSGNPETSTNVGLGTPGYAPVEQSEHREGKGFPVTMDVYALGATMFKMLTGHRPPKASEILNEGFPLPDFEGRRVDSRLLQVVEKAMAPSRRNRYQTVNELLEACGGVGEDEGTVVEVISAPSSESELLHLSEEAPQTVRTPFINGHEYVDLGLSVKWATCNVGAVSPSDYGDYFAWGEIQPKGEYTEENSATCGKEMGDIAGDSRYDAARAHWGGTWRLPTRKEMDELKNKCTWTWTEEGGYAGYRITGSNSNSIFLPAAGCRYGSSLRRAGSYGYYWSSTPYESNSSRAYELYFDSSYLGVYGTGRRFGQPVRPVSE